MMEVIIGWRFQKDRLVALGDPALTGYPVWGGERSHEARTRGRYRDQSGTTWYSACARYPSAGHRTSRCDQGGTR